MKIYQLSLQETLFFYGPEGLTEKDFNKLCISLLDEAASIVYEARNEDMISWNAIVSHLPGLLGKHGFTLTVPLFASVSQFDLDQPSVMLPRMGDQIAKHNSELKIKLCELLQEEAEDKKAKDLLAQPEYMENLRKTLKRADAIRDKQTSS